MLSSEPETENQVPNRGEELTLEQFGEFTHSNTTQHLDKFPPADEDLQPSPSSQSPQNAPRPASRRQLYLMVMADFGLAFVWLSKFAVATYVHHFLFHLSINSLQFRCTDFFLLLPVSFKNSKDHIFNIPSKPDLFFLIWYGSWVR